jgi:hypothetical protein
MATSTISVPKGRIEYGGCLFVNDWEVLVARYFDYFGVSWQYEPRLFELERDEVGNLRSAFRPDFYLPDQDLYLEITAMRQCLASRKSKKVRTCRQKYSGEIKVKLFYRRDLIEIAKKCQHYGIPLSEDIEIALGMIQQSDSLERPELIAA